jgi:RNA polymerase sigma-70 factor (ECF subfamily)
MMDQDLAQLLEQCLKDGATAQWEAFIQRTQPIIASAVFRRLSRSSPANRELASDFIQDCFLRMCANNFRVLRNFRTRDATALRVYLGTIASSIVMDHFRRKDSQTPVDLEDVAPTLAAHDPAAEELERNILLERVERCLSSQDGRSRRLFWLYHRQGLTPKTIAALPDIAMGISGVETALYRLTVGVRECLRKAGVLETRTFREGARG